MRRNGVTIRDYKKLINLMGHRQAAKDSKLLNFGFFVMLNNAVEKKPN